WCSWTTSPTVSTPPPAMRSTPKRCTSCSPCPARWSRWRSPTWRRLEQPSATGATSPFCERGERPDAACSSWPRSRAQRSVCSRARSGPAPRCLRSDLSVQVERSVRLACSSRSRSAWRSALPVLWLGAALLLVRLRGRFLAWLAGRAGGARASTWRGFLLASAGRRGAAINRGLLVAGLLLAFGVNVGLFAATYDQQARVDAQLT